jgi:hypothetical protein
MPERLSQGREVRTNAVAGIKRDAARSTRPPKQYVVAQQRAEPLNLPLDVFPCRAVP